MSAEKILILGVTASGKGRLAFGLAESIGAEIVSVDSMKVYRRMDIGTAKPPRQARALIKHHLIDVVEPSESFSVGRWLELTEDAIEKITRIAKPVIAVGGTALYAKSLLYGLFEGPGSDEDIREQLKQRAEEEGLRKLYLELEKIDQAAAERIGPNDLKRIVRALEVYEITGKSISSFQTQFDAVAPRGNWTTVYLQREKDDASSRINKRVKKMIDDGLVDEVKSLLAESAGLSKQSRCAIGYAEIIDCVEGKTSLEDAVELIKKNTRRFAKNQRTWFKTFRDARGLEIGPGESDEQILDRAKKLLGV